MLATALGLDMQREQDQTLALMKLKILENSVHGKCVCMWGSALVSHDCCDKLSKTWCLYSLTVLEARSWK